MENEQRCQKQWHQCRSRRRFHVQNGSLPLQRGQEARRGWHCCLDCHLWHPLVLHEPRFVLLSFLPLHFDLATKINKNHCLVAVKIAGLLGVREIYGKHDSYHLSYFSSNRTTLYWIENFTTLYWIRF